MRVAMHRTLERLARLGHALLGRTCALLDRAATALQIRRDDGSDIPKPRAEGEPLKLEQLRGAATPPRADPDWERRCWTVFVIGVALVLAALPSISGPAFLRVTVRWLLLLELFAAFALAAVNTYRAARWYGERQRELEAWCASRIAAFSAMDPYGHADYESKLQDGYQHGALALYPSGMNVLERSRVRRESSEDRAAWEGYPADKWSVDAVGLVIPEPYRAQGQRLRVKFEYQRFVDLLRAETHAARARAAGIAAALGGLFIAGFQVYSRLFG